MASERDPIDGLLRRVSGRVRFSQALEVAGTVGAFALGAVLLEGMLARILPLPDWTLARWGLIALPLVIGSAVLFWRPDSRHIRREAGTWVGAPSLFLASAGCPETTLTPLLAQAAGTAARRGLATTPPPLQPGRLVRLLPVLYLPAILAVTAPGRVPTAVPPDDAATRIQESARSVQAANVTRDLQQDRRDMIDAALARASRGDVAALDKALRELKAALRDAGLAREAFISGAASVPALADLEDALRRGTPTAALHALRKLADRIRRGDVSKDEIRNAARAFDAATMAIPSTEGKRRLGEAAEALRNADGASLKHALVATLPHLHVNPSRVRRIERAVITLEAAAGRPGQPATDRPDRSNRTPIHPRGEDGAAARDAFTDPASLDPVEREVLRRYFSGR